MATAALPTQTEAVSWRADLLTPAALRALGIAALVASGTLAFYPLWHELSELWSADPLRSIGAAFPFIAFAGVLRAWRRLGWVLNGSWWGLLPVAVTLPLGRMTSDSILELVLRGHHFGLVHPGVVFLLYGVGTTLLFGGKALLRASVAPLLLLLAVNPVPFAYNTLVDLPLQEISANTARGFSRLIGLHPTGEQLKMMFSPDFGMLIVPGCNGVRGSVTFAYLALVFGYSRSLRPRTLALVTGSAFLLGFALNLLRLCVLVVYYRIGLSYPAIQDYGVGVDYCIGCTIFLLATLILGVVIRSLESATRPAASVSVAPAAGLGYRVAGFLAVVSLFVVPQLRALAAPAPIRLDAESSMRLLPARVGNYQLVRAYYEQFPGGTPAAILGDYASGQGASASRLTLGLYVAGVNHTLALSRMVQGAHLLSSGAVDTKAQGGLPVHLATSFYDDGIEREFNAEASCSLTGCANHLAGSADGALVMQAPSLADMFFVASGRRLPLYVQRHWPDSDPAGTPALRTQFEADAQQFMSQLDVSPLVTQLGSRP